MLKQRFISILVSSFICAVFVASSISPALAASTPRLYIKTRQTTVQQGSNFTVNLIVDGNATNIDTLDITLRFPKENLTFVQMNTVSSKFDTFVPSNPTAESGKLMVSAARLTQSTLGNNVPVANFVFTAAKTGPVEFDVSSSVGAHNGSRVSLITEKLPITIVAGNGTTNSITISDVTVSKTTTSSGEISWKTNAPTTGSVAYGTSTNYGFSASDNKNGTTHKLMLGKRFGGNTTVHFQISAATLTGNATVSGDYSFTTNGYSVQLRVLDEDGKPLVDKEVSVNGSNNTLTTDSSGSVMLANLSAGPHSVDVAGFDSQQINVKPLRGVPADETQTIEVQLASSVSYSPILFVALLVIGIVLVWMLAPKKSSKSEVSKS